MSKSKEIQLKILKNYFHIDGNIATLKLVYETFSELINPNFGDDKIEKLNDKLFSDIVEAVSLLPRSFLLNIQIIIKDFGNYSRQECEDIIRQNIYLNAFHMLNQDKKKKISGWTLVAVGAGVLFVSYLLHSFELWFDLINISGTLFVWEGVNKLLIERTEEFHSAKIIAKSINNITIEGLDHKQEVVDL